MENDSSPTTPQQDKARRHKHKRGSQDEKSENSWESDHVVEHKWISKITSSYLLWNIFISAFLAVAAAMYYFKLKADQRKLSNTAYREEKQPLVVGKIANDYAVISESHLEDENRVQVLSAETQDQGKKIKGQIELFLNAATLEEKASYIRNSDQLIPVMKKYYTGMGGYQPDGFREVVRGKALKVKSDKVIVRVVTNDFSELPIGLKKEEGSWRVDWESWVAYSEMSAEDIIRKRPRKPTLVRIAAENISYYNYGYSNDNKYTSYRLSFRGDHPVLWGYVQKNSKLGVKMAALFSNTSLKNLTLRVHCEPRSKGRDQVIIDELVTSGWILDSNTQKVTD